MKPSRRSDPKVVRAGGGVVARRGDDGWEVVVVHRPKYDDWSIPKGKTEPGEDEAECAVREVEEETGIACVTGPEISSSSYTDRGGRPKVVRYWLMFPESSFWPSAGVSTGEIDEVEWLPVPDALRRLTYDRDRAVLASGLAGMESAAAGLAGAGGRAGG